MPNRLKGQEEPTFLNRMLNYLKIKAVLIHMAYKVGETNLEKYRNFLIILLPI